MTTEQLEAKIKEFVEIAEKLPEQYREKCFEVLLLKYLNTQSFEKRVPEVTRAPIVSAQQFGLPIDVKAFLSQYMIAEDSVRKLFYIEGTEIRPIYQIKATESVATAQVQIALLTALENALKPERGFQFSFEEVKNRCKERGIDYGTNFRNNFKNSLRLFKGLKDEAHVELSPDGKAELADVITAILE